MTGLRNPFGMEFRCDPGYLDTPVAGIPPVTTAIALQDAVAQWSRGELRSSVVDEAIETARDGFACLVGVGSGSVATGVSVSVLVGLVAAQLPAGSRVLTVEHEYSSLTLPFAAQASRDVVLDAVAPGELAARVPDYDLVAFSLVQPRDGSVLDALAVRGATAGTPTRVLVDVTQCAGWMPLEMDWADLVVGGGYKWLLGPRGIAWMAVCDDLIGELTPAFANWRANADGRASIYAAALDPAPGARRFDSSPVWPCAIAAAQSLHWLTSLDLVEVHEHCVGLAAVVRSAFDMPEEASPIVAISGERSVEELRRRGIVATVHGGCTRVGFHLYNTPSDAEVCARALRETPVLSSP